MLAVALGAIVVAISTLAAAHAGESAATYDPTKGTLRLCLEGGEGFVVAEGPEFVRVHGESDTAPSAAGSDVPLVPLDSKCAPDVQVMPGQYWVKVEKYPIARCHSETDSEACEGKVHHLHLYHSTNSATAPVVNMTHETTFEAPDWTPAFLVADRLTHLNFHITEVARPACGGHRVCGAPAGTVPKDLQSGPDGDSTRQPRMGPKGNPKAVSKHRSTAAPTGKPKTASTSNPAAEPHGGRR